MYLNNCRIRYESFLGKYLIGTTYTIRPYVLNGSAAEILNFINQGKTYDEIVNIYKDKYKNVNADKISSFIDKMKEKGIISVRKEDESLAISFEKDVKTNVGFHFSKPDRVQIEIIKKCNLNCEHCYVAGTEAKAQLIEYKLLTKIIDILDNMGVFVVQISGGEPLLHPQINEIIEYITSKNMAVQLFTNATLIEKVLLTKTVSKVAQYIVSIDGNEVFHDKFRGENGAYKKTKNNVIRLVNMGANVKISYCFVQENQEYVNEVADEFYKIGVTSFVCSVPTPMGNGVNYLYSMDDYKILLRGVKAANQNNRSRNNNENVMRRIEGLPPEFSCSAGKTFLYINTDGNVYPCPFFAVEEFRLFNIFEERDTEELWNKAEKLEIFRNQRMKYTSGCENCSECSMWCRAFLYYVTGRIDGVPVYCEKNERNL